MFVGHKRVGKSSFFTALNYTVSQRKDLNGFTSGAGLKEHYNIYNGAWKEDQHLATIAYNEVDFWRKQEIVSFVTHDYPGEESQPFKNGHISQNDVEERDRQKATQGFSKEFQQLCQQARGLVFMIDDSDMVDPEQLRLKAQWFRAVLDYWSQVNQKHPNYKGRSFVTGIPPVEVG
ncbi:MAG: 50S ribosome-binding GTPase [Planctomycetes bacterium]|nr:50S ribosome-binding GTPase [Planctomycetota bacterium]